MKMVRLVGSGKDNNEDDKRWEEKETRRRLDEGHGRQMVDAHRDKSKIQGIEIFINIINLSTHCILRQCFEQKQPIHTISRHPKHHDTLLNSPLFNPCLIILNN
jgi:hypothetical protein